MKKILMATLLLLTLLTTSCGGNSNKITKIVIGVDDEFAPICFYNERNKLVGFDVDLAQEAASRMNAVVEFKSIDWDNKKEEITSGNIDMIWNGLDITEERKEYMIFTKPYMLDRQVVLIKRGSNVDIYSETDLKGKIVGVQAGSTSDDYLSQNENLIDSFKEYRTYGKFIEVVSALRNDEIEVIVCDELVARYEVNKTPKQLELLNVKIGSIAEMAVGFRKDNVELRDKVQEVFDEMVKDGTAKKISEKWFQADVIEKR
ncbi:MAG: amino acid ABC transporter substrate-binding protein [Selenomonadaceae bacterium]|nr:amino acid ABC transporter substrate-binding protein [Selenomonadaceae bacterium]